MTKPVTTGCIKKEPDPTWRTFNLLLKRVSLDDPVGHLFAVDISVDYEKATPKQRLYNEIYPSITEKQKIIDIAERSVFQLIEQYNEAGDGEPRSYRATKKAHVTLFQKRFQPLYLEHLSFLINRTGWQVTKLYLHYSFEQERLKRNFTLMNQRSRQNAKNSIEKDFYKLMNNANFEYDCRNNLDNWQFIPIFDEMNKVVYLKRYYNYFDKEVSKIVSSFLISVEVEEKYNDSLMKLSKDHIFYQIKLTALKTKKQEGLEAGNAFENVP